MVIDLHAEPGYNSQGMEKDDDGMIPVLLDSRVQYTYPCSAWSQSGYSTTCMPQRTMFLQLAQPWKTGSPFGSGSRCIGDVLRERCVGSKLFRFTWRKYSQYEGTEMPGAHD